MTAGVRAILLDIEGTTTPVSFVFETLFPYARERVGAFLEQHWADDDVASDVARLRGEHGEEPDETPPAWSDASSAASVDSAVSYAHWLMDRDRKSTGLKSLQGKIWKNGYETGRLKGEVYEDVVPAIDRWRGDGRKVCIYSSGSVLAQKLLFAHTSQGDLTPRLDGYFDTTTGPKMDAASYRAIAGELGFPPAEILFVSDVVAELDAAREAGMRTAHCVRPGTIRSADPVHPIAEDFTGL